jgi:WhiB family redox-sensing transcriptional regulator
LKNMDLLASQFNPFNGTQLCLDADPDLFFPPDYKDPLIIDEARKVCEDCWIKDSCLKYAMQYPNLDGIWAGTTPHDRKRLRKLNTSQN